MNPPESEFSSPQPTDLRVELGAKPARRFRPIWIMSLLVVLAVGSVALRAWFPKSSPVMSPSASPEQSSSTQPKITWSDNQVEVILSPGESTYRDITFTSSQTLRNVVIQPVSGIAPFLTVTPGTFSQIKANTRRTVRVTFTIASNAALGTNQGAIQLKVGTQTLPQTVKISLNVWAKLNFPVLGVEFKVPPDWTVSTLGGGLTLSNVPRDSLPASETLLGVCKVDFNTIAKISSQLLRDWLTELRAQNGDPPPTSLTTIRLGSLDGLKEIGGEIGIGETVYVAVSDVNVLSISLICGEDVQATGALVFDQIVSTVALP